MEKKFIVIVDDNFHYMDVNERYKKGEYDSLEEAISVCKRIVESSVHHEFGTTAEERYSNYCIYGEDPFIIGYSNFCAREYAEEYCKKHFKKK